LGLKPRPLGRLKNTSGKVNRDLKLSDRVIHHEDGTTTCRDLNAAINIKAFALHPQNKSIPPEGRKSTPEEIAGYGGR